MEHETRERGRMRRPKGARGEEKGEEGKEGEGGVRREVLRSKKERLCKSVPLTGREVNDLYFIVAEPGQSTELWSAPQCHALSVHGGQVRSLRRPADIRVCPILEDTNMYVKATKLGGKSITTTCIYIIYIHVICT